MTKRTTELLVGLFMIAGLAALLFLALQVSGLTPRNAAGTYTVYANFNDTGGLAPRGRVSMAGVTVGTIESISLNKDTFQARVTMAIDAGVDNIPADSSAVIRTSGLLGEQYIDISVGADMESLADGGTFYSTQSAMNLERLISNFASGR
ncbi:outer membrane lipid asymmetry maintenance protein MlaD [Marinobacter qingdaonensis]|jgi:phospholipid/cholesterol/gamma-HCH transport system substrate-binding protein|uniref:Outer membrane lipid asymmetry maintenance protein MlaD n=1 Tax=Marinobacter qingdaonensis TaxID=3108486 RepID=A0ABU5NZZ9_9GAMM|nr:outer membrane lipid asymmetry maintenance protein MlaD [Marinobacter sp. ASW11-75]MEA1081384.1 outer membrane lipid asymmetry maintenance protein MlaD [Marinobacter sp. ASW11-75]MEE3118442.1 outer membrane lipid asymmetry maintenance protein MlaD [Pseudomonadota bacterium]